VIKIDNLSPECFALTGVRRRFENFFALSGNLKKSTLFQLYP
jgi:hypothetical protein